MLAETRICDVLSPKPCGRDAVRYVVVTEGERQGRAVDLCQTHARPLEALLVYSETVDLPSKPRARMEPTKLRTTPRTARFKKGNAYGQTRESARPDTDDETET